MNDDWREYSRIRRACSIRRLEAAAAAMLPLAVDLELGNFCFGYFADTRYARAYGGNGSRAPDRLVRERSFDRQYGPTTDAGPL